MAETIDSKVVEMRFNNQQFESGANQSMSTLDKLKAKLDFKGAAKNLQDLSKASGNVNFDGMQKAIETVNQRFSAMGIMADQVFRRMADSAYNAASAMINKFTLEPIKEGFQSYEQLVNSTQVVLNNGLDAKGEPVNLEKTKDILADLNEYSDKTIYRFSDMTSSLGKFSAAGVDVDNAATAIKGLGNVAAISGASTADFSRAIYNVSQALGQGKMLARDWMSIENANMATKEFKQQLIEAGIAAGTLVKQGNQVTTASKGTVVTWKNLRDTLSDKWLTSDVLINTLSKYADTTTELGKKGMAAAQEVKTFSQMMEVMGDSLGTAWSKVFTNIFGDYDEAKKLWTGVSTILSEIFAKPVQQLGEFTKQWHDLGGRTALIESLSNAFFGLAQILTPIGQAIKEVFPAPTAKQFTMFTKKLAKLTSNLRITDDQAARLQKTFEYLLMPIKYIGKFLIDAATGLAKFAINSAKSATSSVEFLVVMKFIQSVIRQVGEDFKTFYGNFKASLSIVKRSDSFKELQQHLNNIKDALEKLVGPIFRKLGMLSDKDFFKVDRASTMAKNIEKVIDVLNAFFRLIESKGATATSIVDKIKEKFSGFVGTLSGVIDKIKDFFASLKPSDSAVEKVSGIKKVFGSIGDAIHDAISKVSSAKTSASDLVNGASSGFNNFISILSKAASNTGISEFFKDINSAINTSINIAGTTGITAMALSIVSAVKQLKKVLANPKQLISIGDNVEALISSVTGCFDSLQKKLNADTLMSIAKAIAVLAGSLLVLSLIKPERLAASLGAMSAAMGELVAAMAILSKFTVSKSGASSKSGLSGIISGFVSSYSQRDIGAVTSAMIKMSAALLIVSVAMKNMEGVDFAHAAMTWATLGVMVAAMVSASNLIGKGSKSFAKGASAMITMSVSLLILTKSMKGIASLDLAGVSRGLLGISGMLAAVGLFISETNFKNIKTNDLADVPTIVASIRSLAGTMIKLGQLSWPEMVAGLAGLEGLFTELGVFMSTMSKQSFSLSSAMAAIAVAAAIRMLADPFKELAALDFDSINRGMVSLGGIIASVGIFLKAMDGVKGELAASGSLLIAATGIVILTQAFQQLSGLDLNAIGNGLIVLSGSLGALAVALYAMQGSLSGAGALLIASAAIAVMTPQLLLLSQLNLSQIGMGLLALGGALGVMAAGAGIATALAPGMMIFAGAVAAIGAATLMAGVGVLAFGTGLVSMAAGLASLAAIGPAAATSIVTSLSIIATGILTAIPNAALLIVTGITTIITSVCAAIVNSSEAIIGAVVSIITDICTAIQETVPTIADTIRVLLDTIIELIGEYIPKIADLVLDLITAILQTIEEHLSDIVVAALGIIAAFIDGIAAGLPLVIQAAFNLVISFIEGLAQAINTNTPIFIGAVNDLLEAGARAIGEAAGNFLSEGGEIADAFMEGFRETAPDWIVDLGDTIQSGIDELGKHVDDFFDAGANLIQGLIDGIKSLAGKVWDAVSGVASNAVDALTGSEGLDEHSPSKKSHKAGVFFAQGLINGIEEKSKDVKKSVQTLGKETLIALMEALGEHSPSKYTNLDGQNLDEGLIEGGLKKKKKLMKAYKVLGRDLTNTLTEATDSSEAAGNLKDEFEGIAESSSVADEYLNRYGDTLGFFEEETDDATESTKAETEATNENTAATSAATSATKKSTSSKQAATEASEDKSEAEKREAEYLEALAKYTVYASKVTYAYADMAVEMNNVIGNSINPIEGEEEALQELTETIYEESNATEESSSTTKTAAEQAVEHATKVMEAFNKAFEKIRDKIKESIDMFSKFDEKVSDLQDSNKILENTKSQFEGISDWGKKLTALSLRFNDGIIEDLVSEGPESIGKVNGLLAMSAEDAAELNTEMANADQFSQYVTGYTMTARAMAQQMQGLREQAAGTEILNNDIQQLATNYLNLLNSGSATELELTQAMQGLMTACEANGTTAEAVMQIFSNADAITAKYSLDVVENMMKPISVVQQFQNEAQTLEDSLKSSYDSALSIFDAWDKDSDLTTQKLLDNMHSQLDGITNMANNVNTILQKGGTPELVQALAEKGAEYVAAAAQGTEEQLKEMSDLYAKSLTISDSLAQENAASYLSAGTLGGMTYNDALNLAAQSGFGQFLQNGEIIGQNLDQGVINGQASLLEDVYNNGVTAGQTAVDGVADGAGTHSPSVKTYEVGQNLDQGLINGMIGKETSVSNEALAIGKVGVTGVQNGIDANSFFAIDSADSMAGDTKDAVTGIITYSAFTDIGANVSKGLANGISSNASAAISAATNVATSALNAAKTALGIHSPSKEFGWVGKMSVLGFANATLANGALATDAVKSVMQSAADAAYELAETDMNPVITPVVDLSNVQSAIGSVSSFGGTYTLDPQMGQITTPSDNMRALNLRLGNMSNRDIVSAVVSLKQNIDALGDRMERMQIVLDSGVLAGAVSDGVSKNINESVGRRQAVWQ